MGNNNQYNSGTEVPQAYDLDLYQISADGTTATWLADVTNLQATFSSGPTAPGVNQGASSYISDWIQWTFPALTLQPNTVYAWTWHKSDSDTLNSYTSLNTDAGTADLYPGGQIVAIEENGGAVGYSSATLSDQAFDVNLLPVGISIAVATITANPGSPYALSPVTLSDHVVVPTSGTFIYQWYTDDGSGVNPPNYIRIPGATATNLVVYPQDVNPGAGNSYTTNYYFVASGGGSFATNAITLTINSASAPLVLSPTQLAPPLPVVTYQGSSETLTVTENGTKPITNQWQFEAVNGSSFANITRGTNSLLTLTNLQTSASGTYQMTLTNLIGTNITPTFALTVLPIPPAPVASTQKYFEAVYTNHPYAYWRLNETTDPNANDYVNGAAPTVQAWDYSGNGFLATYGEFMTDSNAGPSALTPGFPGFDPAELAAGTASQAGGYLSVPPLNNLTTQTNLTFMAWIYPNGLPGGYTGLLFDRSDPNDPNGTYGFGFSGNAGTTGDLGFTWNNNSSATWSWDSGVPVAPYQWNFVAYVVTPTNVSVYVGNLNNNNTNFTVNNLTGSYIGESFAGTGTISLGAISTPSPPGDSPN